MPNTLPASQAKTPPPRAAHATYLVRKTHLKQRALTLRIPQHVHEALNATRERADKAGFVFDIQSVVVEALERAVTRVSSELSALEQGDAAAVTAQAPRRNRRPVAAKEA